MSDIVERLRQTAHLHAVRPKEHCCWEAADTIDKQAAEIERLRAALEKIEYLDRPQVRGLPRRVSIQEIAAAALAQEKPND